MGFGGFLVDENERGDEEEENSRTARDEQFLGHGSREALSRLARATDNAVAYCENIDYDSPTMERQ